MKKIFLFLLVIKVFSYDSREGIYQASIAPDPSVVIEGCVSAITGSMHVSSTDVIAKGKEPLPFNRSYVNLKGCLQDCFFYIASRGERGIEKRAGWNYLEYTKAHIQGLKTDSKYPTVYRLDFFDPEGF